MKCSGVVRAANLAFVAMLAMTSQGLAVGGAKISCPSVSGFTAHTEVDSKYNDIRKVDSTDLNVLAQACMMECSCNAFNNHGWLKTNVKVSSDNGTAGWCLYTRDNSTGCDVGMGNKTSCGGSAGSCIGGMCCSKNGLCGTSSDHCGSGCQSAYGQCSGGGGGLGGASGGCPTVAGYSYKSRWDNKGYDIRQYKTRERGWISNAAASCSQSSSCMAFNTDGWLKSSVSNLRDASKYFTSSCQGIYIRSSSGADRWSSTACSWWKSQGFCSTNNWWGGYSIHDYWCISTCKSSWSSVGTAPAEIATDMVNRHNKYREMHRVGDLTWSNDIAASAQGKANSCAFNHDSLPAGYGENLFWGTWGYSTGLDAVDAWYNESKYYTYRQGYPSNFGQVSRFTQVVWKGTTEVGCAMANCNNNMYLVCRYRAPGNVVGQFGQNVFPKGR